MQFYNVGHSSDIALGEMKAVSAGSTEVLLANVAGKFYAIPRKCSHMGADLCKGTLDDTAVICPKHGAKFSLETGEALGSAKVLFFKMKPKNVASYAVKIENGDVFVGV